MIDIKLHQNNRNDNTANYDVIIFCCTGTMSYNQQFCRKLQIFYVFINRIGKDGLLQLQWYPPPPTNGTSNLLSNVCIHLPINTGTFMVSS